MSAADELEGALQRGAHDGALRVLDARVGPHDLEQERGGRQPERVLAVGRRGVGRQSHAALEQLS